MRMWQVNPRMMCKNHILGEHRELHALVGSLQLGQDLTRYTNKGLVEVHSLLTRHEELVAEMTRRGWNHHTPFPTDIDLPMMGQVDTWLSIRTLYTRCENCRPLIYLHEKDRIDQWIKECSSEQ